LGALLAEALALTGRHLGITTATMKEKKKKKEKEKACCEVEQLSIFSILFSISETETALLSSFFANKECAFGELVRVEISKKSKYIYIYKNLIKISYKKVQILNSDNHSFLHDILVFRFTYWGNTCLIA